MCVVFVFGSENILVTMPGPHFMKSSRKRLPGIQLTFTASPLGPERDSCFSRFVILKTFQRSLFLLVLQLIVG